MPIRVLQNRMQNPFAVVLILYKLMQFRSWIVFIVQQTQETQSHDDLCLYYVSLCAPDSAINLFRDSMLQCFDSTQERFKWQVRRCILGGRLLEFNPYLWICHNDVL